LHYKKHMHLEHRLWHCELLFSIIIL